MSHKGVPWLPPTINHKWENPRARDYKSHAVIGLLVSKVRGQQKMRKDAVHSLPPA